MYSGSGSSERGDWVRYKFESRQKENKTRKSVQVEDKAAGLSQNTQAEADEDNLKQNNQKLRFQTNYNWDIDHDQHC